MNVNTLFDQDRIVSNFSNIQDMFLTTSLNAASDVIDWPEAREPLAEFCRFEGKTKLFTDWVEQTSTKPSGCSAQFHVATLLEFMVGNERGVMAVEGL